MQAWLGFLTGVLVVVGLVLIFSAAAGIAYYGLAVQIEVALAIIVFVTAGILGWIFYVGFKAQYRRIKTGKEALIGAVGVVTTPLNPKGEIRVEGEFWQALTQDCPLNVGVEVDVVGMEGMFLVVKPTSKKLNSSKPQITCEG
jgi:membrane-bound ClpP family serine protease